VRRMNEGALKGSPDTSSAPGRRVYHTHPDQGVEKRRDEGHDGPEEVQGPVKDLSEGERRGPLTKNSVRVDVLGHPPCRASGVGGRVC
jgi:hypothetical protein